jgi:hypothetical protein
MQRRYGPEYGIPTGRQIELDAFGPTQVIDIKLLAPILSSETLRTIALIKQGQQLPKEQVQRCCQEIKANKKTLFNFVKNSQEPNYDPTNPRRGTARDLRVGIIDELNLTEAEADRVKIFSATQTPLDIIGIDAFIAWQPKPGDREYFVTLDITGRLEEKTGKEADIVFSELPDPEENEEAYLEEIEEIAKNAAQILRKFAKL